MNMSDMPHSHPGEGRKKRTIAEIATPWLIQCVYVRLKALQLYLRKAHQPLARLVSIRCQWLGFVLQRPLFCRCITRELRRRRRRHCFPFFFFFFFWIVLFLFSSFQGRFLVSSIVFLSISTQTQERCSDPRIS